MKYLIITIMLALVFCSCQKEDALENELDFSNVFEITDNPDDVVQHARFEIYDQYKVSVYFNDTIGRQFIRNDINGNPYYRYETLDMSWTFFSSNDEESNVSYRYFFTEGETRQLQVLAYLNSFLEGLSEKLRPAMILAVDSVYVVRADGVVSSVIGWKEDLGEGSYAINVGYRNNFRGMFITSLADVSNDLAEDLFVKITNDLALVRINNFTTELASFGEITPDDYGKDGTFVYPTDDEMVEDLGTTADSIYVHYYGASWLGYGRPDAMFDTGYEEEITGQGLSTDFVEASRVKYASIVGPLGFVMPANILTGTGMRNSPATVEDDIEGFTQLALMYSPEEVEHYWGGYPLVMQKYNIIASILEDEIGIEL